MKQSSIAAAAAVRLTLRHPFFVELLYSMGVKEAGPAEGVLTEATDGRSLWINPVFWKSIPLDQQVAELVHELCHKMLLHTTRRGHRDHKLWNIACDYVINAWMAQMGFAIPNDWLLDTKYTGWLAEAVYNDLVKKQPPKKGGSGQYPKHGKPADDQTQPELAPGRDDLRDAPGNPEEVSKLEDQIKATVDRAMATAKAMGKLPAGLEQGIQAAFKALREPWYNHLHRYMQSLVMAEYNWARINRRTLRTHGIFTPMHLSEALGEIALFIDTSGSCVMKAQQAKFAEHLNAILAEAKPRRVHTYYFDSAVYPGEIIEAGELDIVTRPRGGGGTRFEPIFQAIEDDNLMPEVVIILTDLDGSFPREAPDYNVVWANVLDNDVAPFGETIHLTE